MTKNLTINELFNFVEGSSITGESAYEIWKSLNPNGKESEFLEFLRTGDSFEYEDFTEEQLKGLMPPVTDSLESESTTEALSANQGRALQASKAGAGSKDLTGFTVEDIAKWIGSCVGRVWLGRTKLSAEHSPYGTTGWYRCIWESQNTGEDVASSALSVIAMGANGDIWNGYIATNDSGNYVLAWNVLSAIKSKTLERTTSTKGNINLTVESSKVLSAYVTNSDYIALIFNSNDKDNVFAKIVDESLNVVANVAVTVEVLYI